MWRKDGAGEFYNYYPSGAHSADYCNTAPMSKCDPSWGDSSKLTILEYMRSATDMIVGRGSFTWATGQWTTVAQRLKLNDAGQSNGEQELFVNGQSVLHLTGLQIAADPSTKIYGIMAQTFFVSYVLLHKLWAQLTMQGGSDSTWASPQNQDIWFKDFSLAVIA
jgi:hypothetical protein